MTASAMNSCYQYKTCTVWPCIFLFHIKAIWMIINELATDKMITNSNAMQFILIYEQKKEKKIK